MEKIGIYPHLDDPQLQKKITLKNKSRLLQLFNRNFLISFAIHFNNINRNVASFLWKF